MIFKQIQKTIMLFAIISIGTVYSVFAQLSMANGTKEVIVPNTQTYDFIRYGQVSTSLYTGTINYALNVYTYKDKDFTIPINFIYASDGFKPNSRAGELGLGWTLEAGGCITREIRGIPDDKMESFNIGTSCNGFLELHQSGLSEADLIKDVAISDDGLSANFFYRTSNAANSINYEAEPDIFHFNFLGHSGSFHLWYNNEIKVFNTSGQTVYKIDVSNLGRIIITTSDGYVYDFGTSGYSTEYTKESFQDTDDKSIYLSWKLTAITAPSGRKVTFTYNYMQDASYFTYNYQPSSSYSYTIFNGDFSSSHSSMLSLNSTTLYSCPIKNINIDNTDIKFNYITTTGELRNHITLEEAQNARPSHKLSSIKVISQNDTIAQCDIAYKNSVTSSNSSNSTLNNNIYFLGSIDIKGEGIYDFEYYNRSTYYPNYGSFSVDHWGYYNARNESFNPSNFIDYITYRDDGSYIESINTTLRNANFNSCKMGMLSKITYPTGGYSDIEYESHDYGLKVVRNYIGSYYPTIEESSSNDIIAGGVRVKNITNYASTGEMLNAKSYSYTNSNGISSGILMMFPRYGVEYTATSGSYVKKVKYCSLYDLYKFNGPHIGYSQVVETNTDNSKIVYSFTDYEEYPDIAQNYRYNSLNVPTKVMMSNGSSTWLYYSVNNNSSSLVSLLSPLKSMHSKRGKIKSIDLYNANGILVKSTNNLYDSYNSFSYSYPLHTGEIYRYIENTHFNFLNTEVSETEYEENGNITDSVSYTYMPDSRVLSSIKINSDGTKTKTEYQYADSLSGIIYDTIRARNLLSYPIQETIYKINDDELEIQIGGRRYTYGLFNNIVKVSKEESYNPHTCQWETTTTYTNYDNQGNLLESRDANGVPTSYIWGYNGLYMVGKIENMYRNSINSTIGTSPLSGCLSPAQISSIKTAAPDALVSIYEYKPMVGLSKVVQPSGEVLTYQYNSTGKLMGIYNTKGEKVEENLYSPDNKQ